MYLDEWLLPGFALGKHGISIGKVHRVVSTQGHDLRGVGFRIRGVGFRIRGVGFRIRGVGFRIRGVGFIVSGKGCNM